MCIKRPITIRPSPKETVWDVRHGRWCEISSRTKNGRIRLQSTMNLKWSEIELLIPCFDTFFTHCATAAPRKSHGRPQEADQIDWQRTHCIWLHLSQKSFLFWIVWKLKIMENDTQRNGRETERREKTASSHYNLKHNTSGERCGFVN